MARAKTPRLDRVAARTFQKRLLAWYRRHGRDLPWRETRNPYDILVSEIMLQQTQVERVIPKYHEFLNKYPTVEDLARSPVEDVTKTWYPLGYNIRPVRLHGIAREAVARYGGAIPSSEEALLSMKGIGRYTAGAVRSFAFGFDAAILDTNVARVLSRVFLPGADPKRGADRTKLWTLSEALIPRGKGYDFNQALMDFGATVCVARSPACSTCTMRPICKTYRRETRRHGSGGRPPRRG
jgi:A/G-specific adenine glycosylase